MAKKFLLKKINKTKMLDGFTLIELLVVIGILGVLVTTLIVILNPVKQLNKAFDSGRRSDLKQIATQLDAYAINFGCYPTSITFGGPLTYGSTVFMDKVPNDRDCTNGQDCYGYISGDAAGTGVTCPTWGVLFAKLKSETVDKCMLDVSCRPSDYGSKGYNYCVQVGSVPCSIIAGGSTGGGGGGGGGGTPTGTTTASPSPTNTPLSFVTRCNGSKLCIDATQVKFAGANVYWLGLAEANGVHYPTHIEIDDAIDTVAEMGGNVIRTFGAVGVGCPLCIEPTLNSFNSSAFDSLDYAIKVAKDNNIRIIMPLVDNYAYYEGGKFTYLGWRGIADDSTGQFYSNAQVIADFEAHINYVLNHVNAYTGLAYKNDPTIMAWETGNETYPGTSCCGTTATWANTIATYIKSIAPNQLVADGHYGLDSGSYGSTAIDILSDHYSSPSSKLTTNQNVATTNNKVFMLGEHHWTQTKANGQAAESADLQSYLTTIRSAGISISLYWDLYPHDDTNGFVQHGDGYTLHYTGDNVDMTTRAGYLRAHAYLVNFGIAAPASSTPVAPTIYSPTLSSGNVVINWRGVVGAASYQLERSQNQSTWTTVSSTLTDNNSPKTDAGAPTGTVYYRIKASNLNGVFGPYSSTVSIVH